MNKKVVMRENVLLKKTFDFAVEIVKLVKTLHKEEKEFVISKQLLRSATSVGANSEESNGGISKADFSHKISIAYKEARESHFWLRLLYATEYIGKRNYDKLVNDCDEICRILFSILKSTRIKSA